MKALTIFAALASLSGLQAAAITQPDYPRIVAHGRPLVALYGHCYRIDTGRGAAVVYRAASPRGRVDAMCAGVQWEAASMPCGGVCDEVGP